MTIRKQQTCHTNQFFSSGSERLESDRKCTDLIGAISACMSFNICQVELKFPNSGISKSSSEFRAKIKIV